MKKAILVSLALMMAGIAGAATVNIPSGLTGLWRFQNTNDLAAGSLGAATVGSNIMFSNTVYGANWLGPWTVIGGDGWLSRYSDGSVFQESSWNYMAINPNFTVKGGQRYVNEYTVAIDYSQTSKGLPSSVFNSLFQTSWNGTGNDGDLHIAWTTDYTNATIGADAIGYSPSTFDASKWHRIVWSVSNGNFFRVYIDGTLYLDGTPQEVDGTYSLYPDRFNLFADNDWNDAWGLVGTVATWNRALTTEEVTAMGGWIDGAATPTELVYSNTPEVVSVSPVDGETNAAPGFAYQALIFDPVLIVDTNSVQLLLDGFPVTPVVTRSAGSVFVRFSAGGLLQGGSTHKYTLIASASGIYATNEVTFTVENYTSATYEWRFTQGDLTTDLGNGTMDYAYDTTPGFTSFGTTDGSTVPHINGSPAKYMHVPAFTSPLDGYYLQFNDTGPNGGSSTYVNRYTILFDVMVPGPLNWTPFFNTDPYNGNDADFYLAPEGSVGITAIYSAAAVVAENAWHRIAFVVDLANSAMAFYVNGTQVAAGTQAGSGLDGRWSLYSNLDPGPDLLLFSEPTGTYTHELYVSSVAFTDRDLSAAELAGLGGPSADGILVPSFTSRPALAIQATSGGATVSWPAHYLGYALEQSGSLTAPEWKPVAGITNNAVDIAVGEEPRFFRLVQ